MMYDRQQSKSNSIEYNSLLPHCMLHSQPSRFRMDNSSTSKGDEADISGCPEVMSDEYKALLAEANEEDFSDFEASQVLQSGLDLNENRVLIFLPRFGFREPSQDWTNGQLRRMLLFFVWKAHHVCGRPFTLVYDHMKFSLFSQQPLIYRVYSMLPREYKKNISKLYVVHPTSLIRMFFQRGVKHFISKKFYDKLQFVDSIIELQPLIAPLGWMLPVAYLKFGDDKTSRSAVPDSMHMPPLDVSFVPSLGTTQLIQHCVDYLKAENRLQTKGLFRLAGDQAVLDLARPRLFSGLDSPSSVVIGQQQQEAGGEAPRYSTLTVTEVHTVTSILGMSLRHLPEPLISRSAHPGLLEATKSLDCGDLSTEEWLTQADGLLNSMPDCHIKTLQHLLRYLQVQHRFAVQWFLDGFCVIICPEHCLPPLLQILGSGYSGEFHE